MKWGLSKRKVGDSNFGIDSFKRDIFRVFDDFFTMSPSTLLETGWAPNIDLKEDGKAIHVKADIPGIDEKDLNVSLENNTLVISGERREERSEGDRNGQYIVSERHYGSFYRSIQLPDGIRADKIRAALRNGVLRIEIPKEESSKTGKIKIDIH